MGLLLEYIVEFAQEQDQELPLGLFELSHRKAFVLLTLLVLRQRLLILWKLNFCQLMDRSHRIIRRLTSMDEFLMA